MTPDFFRSLARAFVAETVGMPRDAIEKRLADTIRDAFESGAASTLVAVVSAVQAVHVPRAGMVIFKVPGLTDASERAFRSDLNEVARLLAERLGFAPIILVVPADAEAQVVDYDDGTA